MSEARIYVGTYNKYNGGSINGKWLDLSDYDNEEEFNQACLDLHSDEEDPELMFQDYEGIPDTLISESHLDSKYWDIQDLINDSCLDDDAIKAGLSLGIPLESIEDAYYGQHDSDTDLAYDYIESTGMLQDVPDSITMYFDYEAFGRDLAMDFSEQDGFYFSSNY